MKKLLALLLLAGPVWAGADAPFLWETRGPAARHFLLGSVHMLPETAYPLPAALDAAYAATRNVVFEADLAQLAAPELQGRMLGAAKEVRPGGLRAQVGAPLYSRLQKHAAALGMPTPVCETFRAWFCALTLELFALQQAGFEVQHGVDQYIYGRARDDGRTIAALETPAQQLALFTTMPDAMSNGLLAATLDESTTASQTPAEFLRLWRDGDFAALAKIVVQLRKRHPEVHARLLAERNRAWLPQLVERLNGVQPTLIVVGAAHFAGPDGLLALLAEKGFELKIPVEQKALNAPAPQSFAAGEME